MVSIESWYVYPLSLFWEICYSHWNQGPPLAKHYWVNSCNIMISSFTPSTSMPSLFSHTLVRPRIVCLHGWRTVSYNKFEWNSSYLLSIGIIIYYPCGILSYHSRLWLALINRVVIILSMQTAALRYHTNLDAVLLTAPYPAEGDHSDGENKSANILLGLETIVSNRWIF